jgi:uncharacterized protein YndB with AHSA1/START domain
MRTLVLASALIAAPADAEVRASAPDGFHLVHMAQVNRAPQEIWEALADWGGWWPDAHTFSGSAANIDLDLEANGELEEEWDGGEVLHAVVLQTRPAQLLRLSGGFGPLQALPVNAVLDIALVPEGGGTRVTLSYRVAGSASEGLDRYAAPVDRVFAEAFARLITHTAPADPKED